MDALALGCYAATSVIDRGNRTTAIDRVLRRTILQATTVTDGAIALGGSASATAAQEEPDDGEGFPIPELDLQTLEAEVGDEVVQAESYRDRWPGSTNYVGEAAGRPGLFVSVVHRGKADENGNDLAVYLCDGEVGADVQSADVLWLTGAFESPWDGTVIDITREGASNRRPHPPGMIRVESFRRFGWLIPLISPQ